MLKVQESSGSFYSLLSGIYQISVVIDVFSTENLCFLQVFKKERKRLYLHVPILFHLSFIINMP